MNFFLKSTSLLRLEQCKCKCKISGQIYTVLYVRIQKPDNVCTYTVASNPVVTGSDFLRRFNLFLEQCVQSTQSTACICMSSSPVPRKPGESLMRDDTGESLMTPGSLYPFRKLFTQTFKESVTKIK